MAKARISQQTRRNVLLYGMLHRARRRRKMVQSSIVHTLLVKRMRLIKIAMLLIILVTTEKYMLYLDHVLALVVNFKEIQAGGI